MANTESPWLDEMISRLGVQEFPGKKHNPEIVKWFHDIGHTEINDDETAWCATTMTHALMATGYPMPPFELRMWARVYMTYGVACEPKPGAIAVWPRGKSKSLGHVNVVESVREKNGRIEVQCVGGNQGGLKGGDAVTRSDWRDANDALRFRWPVKPTVKDLRKAGSTEIKQADTLEAASTAATAVAGTATIIKTATETPAPSIPLTPESASEHIGAIQQLMEALNALAIFVVKNPWLAAVAFGSIVGLWLARSWKAGRINRHILGFPLSSETEGGSDA